MHSLVHTELARTLACEKAQATPIATVGSTPKRARPNPERASAAGDAGEPPRGEASRVTEERFAFPSGRSQNIETRHCPASGERSAKRVGPLAGSARPPVATRPRTVTAGEMFPDGLRSFGVASVCWWRRAVDQPKRGRTRGGAGTSPHPSAVVAPRPRQATRAMGRVGVPLLAVILATLVIVAVVSPASALGQVFSYTGAEQS
jgi:hypothetical protein